MKLLAVLLVTACCINLSGSDKDLASVYEKLKAETGASDEELEEGIKFFTKFYVLMHDEIKAGTVNVEELVATSKSLKKDVKDIVAAMQRDDEMTAMMTLLYLKALERNDIDAARELMAKQLARFAEKEDPSTETSRNLQATILEYSKTSPSLKPLIQQREEPGSDPPSPPEAEANKGRRATASPSPAP
jgi:hypothetical protein